MHQLKLDFEDYLLHRYIEQLLLLNLELLLQIE